MLENLIALAVGCGGIACLWLAIKNSEIMYSTSNWNQEAGLKFFGKRGTRFIYCVVGLGLVTFSILLFIGKVKI